MMNEIFKKTKRLIRNPNEVKAFVIENEQYLSPIALVFGFVVDSFTLTRVDLWLDNVILLTYLVIVSLCIFGMNADDSDRFRNDRFKKYASWFPIIMQFALGGLFSGFVVLYSRSSTLSSSWPFMLILIGLLIGNEFFRERYSRIQFQIGILYTAIFSYLVFAVPVLINRVGVLTFIISNIAALLILERLVRLLSKITPWKIEFNKRNLYKTVFSLVFIFNLLYFTNIMPPIPLSLKEVGVYHNARRVETSYTLQYEPESWTQFYRDSSSTFHQLKGEPVYVYSSVFAPADIKSDIVHQWSVFDSKQEKWVVTDNITYPIIGGNSKGYRGFTVKRNIGPGKWQVHVKNQRGQVLGRLRFEIVEATEPPVLLQRSR